jgi:GH24 family phage-related lysozyme (muramidase)
MTPAGVELIRFFEGLCLEAYLDVAGNKTIGYGHLLKPGDGGKAITKQEADALLAVDIAEHEKAVLTITSGSNGVTADMESALTCLAFNIGLVCCCPEEWEGKHVLDQNREAQGSRGDPKQGRHGTS